MNPSLPAHLFRAVACCAVVLAPACGRLRERYDARLTYRVLDPGVSPQQALEAVRARLDAHGFRDSHPSVAANPDGTLSVSLSGVTREACESARKLLLVGGPLQFRLLGREARPLGWASPVQALAHFRGKLPEDCKLLPELSPFSLGGEIPPQAVKAWHLVQRTNYFDFQNITEATSYEGANPGHATIALSLNPAGVSQVERLSTLASEQALLMAFVFNRRVVSIVACKGPIRSDHIAIDGAFAPQDARDLAQLVRQGSLPFALHLVSETRTRSAGR